VGGFIDLAAWKYRQHFEFFRGYANPFFSVCVDADVTVAWRRSREPGGPSFTLATLFALLQAANAVEAMHLRVRHDRVWRHDRLGVGTTVLRDDETFGFALLEHADDFGRFAAVAAHRIQQARQGGGISDPVGDDDVVYHSTLPWLRFTSFANAMDGRDSIPRVVFGRCVPSGDRMVMPVAVEVHHAVMHGLDVARFYEQLQESLSDSPRKR
jgi:chloramphenicol O-acetyltransferase type A